MNHRDRWFAYVQQNGAFYEVWDGGYRLMCMGYSGKGAHVNFPAHQDLVGKGPIPAGWWEAEAARTHPTLGPVAIPLKALKGTNTFKRTGFYIHGDNVFRNRSASSGCIILNRIARDYIAARPGWRLLVVPSGSPSDRD